MVRDSSKHYILPLAFIAVLVIPPSTATSGQLHHQNSRQEQSSGRAEIDIPRWRSLLDQLVIEARSLPQEKTRPYMIAEIADAYWDVDRAKSSELFMDALEAALSIGERIKDSRSALRQVIALAAKRDPLLAKQLTDRTLELSGEYAWASSESLAAASDLLEVDPRKAAQLLVSNAAAGPSLDVAWSILQLYKRDPSIAEEVYRAYLNRFTSNQSPGLERLLWLGGYPFGYSEAFGVDSTKIIGFNGLRGPRITSNPTLARTFLDIAFRATRQTLVQIDSVPPSKAEALSGAALFAILYLLPEVERYVPQTLQGWQGLYRRAFAGTPAPQRESIVARVKDIIGARSTAGSHEPAQSYDGGDPQASVERANKLPRGCERDREYTKAAIRVGYGKDFTRALEVAERIDNPSMRDAVRQYLYYDISNAATEKGDPGNLVDARKYADQVTLLEHRALLYVKIARAAQRHKDQQQATELLRDTRRLAEDIREPSMQASVLLVASAGFAEFDTTEASEVLGDAIKAINRVQTQDVDGLSILRRVNFSCSGEDPSWYGASERAERISINETLASVAGRDVEGALILARGIEDSKTRVRALAWIVKAVIKRP